MSIAGPLADAPPRYTAPGMKNHAPGKREIEAAFTQLDVEQYALPEQLESTLITPALVIYLDVVRRNVAEILRVCGGDADRWRPHCKTTKTRVVYAELARAGVQQFKCATTREADVLASVLLAEGVAGGDILVAYPLVGPGLARLQQVADKLSGSVTFSVLCETAEAAAKLTGSNLGYFVDINPGMHRTGMALEAAESGELLSLVAANAEGFRGLHFYDGHAARWGEQAERQQALHELYERLLALDASLSAAGMHAGELITAGTPALTSSMAHEGLAATKRHRVSPGTVVFHDYQYDLISADLNLEPAAIVLSTVVSHPCSDIFTLDAGSKALAAESGHPMAYILGSPEFEPILPSEEHLPVHARGNARPAHGDVKYLVPRHVCPTVNAHEGALVMDRDESGELFALGFVEIEARAHDWGEVQRPNVFTERKAYGYNLEDTKESA